MYMIHRKVRRLKEQLNLTCYVYFLIMSLSPGTVYIWVFLKIKCFQYFSVDYFIASRYAIFSYNYFMMEFVADI